MLADPEKNGRMNWTQATPEEAKAVWDSLDSPSYDRVAMALGQVGKKVSKPTLWKWHKNDWKHIRPSRAKTNQAKGELDVTVPIITGNENLRVAELAELMRKAHRADRELSEFETTLLPLAREVSELDDDKLLAESHRSLLQLSTLGCRMVMLRPDNFNVHPEKIGNLAKALGYCVDVVTTSLNSARMDKIMAEQPKDPRAAKVIVPATPAGEEPDAYPPGEDPFDDLARVRPPAKP